MREECRKNNTKFVDRAFPADKNSLNFSIPNREITWRRISEIIPNCVMEEGGINPADIHQGNIGDCYFLASISALA
jgi:calpain-5